MINSDSDNNKDKIKAKTIDISKNNVSEASDVILLKEYIENPNIYKNKIKVEIIDMSTSVSRYNILKENDKIQRDVTPSDTILWKRYIENLDENKNKNKDKNKNKNRNKNREDTIDNIFSSIPGLMGRHEIAYLYDIASNVKKGAIVEIGSYYGLSTICIAKGSKAGYNMPVYSIDPQNGYGFTPDPEWNVDNSLGIPDEKYYIDVGINLKEFKQRLKQFNVDDIVIPLVGYSEQIYKRGWNIDIGMLFIDADPRYNYIKMDIENFGRHVISGGIIILHDSGTPGVESMIKIMINSQKYDIIDGVIFTAIVK